jgi:hypothetical protein
MGRRRTSGRLTIGLVAARKMPTLRQNMRLQVCVSSQHLPVTVTGDEGHFRDLITCFEKAACGLMEQVVKAQVADPKRTTRAAKGSSNRATVIGKDAAVATRPLLLLQHQDDGVPAGVGSECDCLVVTTLVSRVLSIANDRNAVCQVGVFPPETTNLVLGHAGRHSKLDDAADGDLLLGIAVEMDQNTVEFCVCWSPIPLLIIFPISPSRLSAMRAFSIGSAETGTPWAEAACKKTSSR